LTNLYDDFYNTPDPNSLQEWINAMVATSYSFVYTAELASTDFGNANSTNKLGEFLSLVGYIIDRINKLCLPCCIKEKITTAIMDYVTNNLSPIDGDGAPGALQSFGTQHFYNFCDNNNVPKCGPIYVTYYTVSALNDVFPSDIAAIQGVPDINGNPASDQQTITNFANTNNYVIQFLNIAQFYLKSYFATKCCCGESHDLCDCKLKYYEVCQFVFGRLCVIERKLVWDNTD